MVQVSGPKAVAPRYTTDCQLRAREGCLRHFLYLLFLSLSAHLPLESANPPPRAKWVEKSDRGRNPGFSGWSAWTVSVAPPLHLYMVFLGELKKSHHYPPSILPEHSWTVVFFFVFAKAKFCGYSARIK